MLLGHVLSIIEHIYVVHGKNYISNLLLLRKIIRNKFFENRNLTLYRSIRIVGTHNTVNKVFHLVSMEVYYLQKPFALVGDIYGSMEKFIDFNFDISVYF